MVGPFIILSALGFMVWSNVFHAKWWWLDRRSLFSAPLSSEERTARWTLLLVMFAIACPIMFGSKIIAVPLGVDERLWAWFGFVVGIFASRPVCTLIWPDRIRAGDENAAKRDAARREKRAANRKTPVETRR
jgi:hypothetical protein